MTEASIDVAALLATCRFDALDFSSIDGIYALGAGNIALCMALQEAGLPARPRYYRAQFIDKQGTAIVDLVDFLIELDGQVFDSMGHRSLEDVGSHLQATEGCAKTTVLVCRFTTPKDCQDHYQTYSPGGEFDPNPSFEQPEIAAIVLPSTRAWVQSFLLQSSTPTRSHVRPVPRL